MSPRLAAALNYPERRHYSGLLQHRAGRHRLDGPGVIVPDKQPTSDDVAIARRLLAAYGAASELGQGVAIPGRTDIWTFNHALQHGYTALLGRNNPDELGAYLCNVWRHDAALGIAQGHLESERIRQDPAFRRSIVLRTRDKLVSLAEAVGAAPVENPEVWPPQNRLAAELGPLVAGIAERLGLDIAPPDVDGGALKLKTPQGLFAARDLYAIFTAHLMRQALGDAKSLRVCEIGGGSGRAAYWGSRAGLGPYTVIDLPHVNVVQGFYLAKGLGADRVAFYGENGDVSVRVLPNRATEVSDDHRYDLVLNQDSFPEMHPSIVSDYLTWIVRTCHGGLLLSVNHESKARYGSSDTVLAHVSVPEAVARHGGFERLQRYPYWLRRGYVTELYRVAG